MVEVTGQVEEGSAHTKKQNYKQAQEAQPERKVAAAPAQKQAATEAPAAQDNKEGGKK